jgi:Putative transposase
MPDALEQAFQNGQLNFQGDLKLRLAAATVTARLGGLFVKLPFGGAEYVLHYLGRYTHRVAISNYRLVPLTEGQVIFACVILLTTTNRSYCPYRSMNSCATPYCTSFR